MNPKADSYRVVVMWTLAVAVGAASFGCGYSSSDDTVTATGSDAVLSDLFASGREVRVTGRVDGDVAAAGAEVTVAAPVQGYVMSAGRTVHLEAPVGNDLWAAGESVTVDSTVANNAQIAGRRVYLSPSSEIGHDARLAGARVRTEARVANDLSIGAARAEIGGEVGGTVRANAARVTLLPDAVVRGNLVVRSPEPPEISPGAQVMGRVDYQAAARDSWWSAWPALWLGLFLSLLVLNTATLLLAPVWSGRVAEVLRTRSLRSILYGILVLVVAPFAIAILAVTVVGIPVAIVLTALYIAGVVLAASFVSYRVGVWIFERFHRANVSRWSAMAAGALVVSLGISLPLVGWAIAAVVVAAGAGALALVWRERRGYVPQSA